MKDLVPKVVDGVSTLLQHTNLSVTLTGWPAAVAVLGVCATVIAVCDISTRPDMATTAT